MTRCRALAVPGPARRDPARGPLPPGSRVPASSGRPRRAARGPRASTTRSAPAPPLTGRARAVQAQPPEGPPPGWAPGARPSGPPPGYQPGQGQGGAGQFAAEQPWPGPYGPGWAGAGPAPRPGPDAYGPAQP